MSKYDSLVKKAAFYEKLALYGNRRDFLFAVAQATPSASGDPGSEGYFDQLGSPTQTTSTVNVSATPPVSKEMQEMLNQLLFVNKRLMMPIKTDGIYGKETAKAFDLFKETFNKPANMKNIQEEFNNLNKEPADLTDAAKQQEEYQRSQFIPPGMPGYRG